MEKELPKNWIETELGEITSKPQYGWTSKAGVDGDVKYLRTTDLSRGKVDWNLVPFCIDIPDDISKYQVEKDDILISRAGSVGLSYRIEESPEKAVFASYLIRFKPYINAKLIEYYLKSSDYWNAISDVSAGIAVQNINAPKLSGLNFPLPPLTEQNRIVAKLDSLFAQLESIKISMAKIPVLLKNFRQQVLTQAVTGKLTEEWREGKELNLSYDLQIDEFHSKKLNPIKLRGKDFFENAQSLYDLPDSWKWIRLFKLVNDNKNSICAGPFGTIFKAKDFKTEGIPIIFLKHVKKERFNFNKPVFMDSAVYEKFHREYTVYGGELLVTKLGDPPGEATIFPKDFGIAMVTPDVMKASIDENIILTKFVSYFFNSNSTKEIISEISFGMTRLRIDLGMFKAMPIPTPSFEEQQEIVARVESLFAKADAIEEKYKNLKAKIETLPQTILHKAFKGELTEQLEADGDARVLLEEIAALKKEKSK